MPRLLLKCALITALTLMIMGLVARTFGAIQPPNSTLRGFTQDCDGQPQPCWYGIVPGVTTVSESHEFLGGYAYPETCVHIYDTASIITQLELWPCALLPPLYLGDTVNQLGSIKGVTIIPNNSDIVYINDMLIFKNTFVTAHLSYTAWRKQRFYTVVPITLSAAPVKKIDFK
jgi:hypothetical protein